MRTVEKRIPRYRMMRGYNVAAPPKTPDEGLVLTDMSLRPIACDRGAAAILTANGSAQHDTSALLPQEVLEWLADRSPDELASGKLAFRVGKKDYTCRTYVMQPETGLPAMLAVHIERVSSLTDPLRAVATKYRLTEREEEALRGIAMGLSSKELAERMNISANTVKVFLRLIMIKMGVTTRGGIVAQVLETQTMSNSGEQNSFSAGAGA